MRLKACRFKHLDQLNKSELAYLPLFTRPFQHSWMHENCWAAWISLKFCIATHLTICSTSKLVSFVMNIRIQPRIKGWTWQCHSSPVWHGHSLGRYSPCFRGFWNWPLERGFTLYIFLVVFWFIFSKISLKILIKKHLKNAWKCLCETPYCGLSYFISSLASYSQNNLWQRHILRNAISTTESPGRWSMHLLHLTLDLSESSRKSISQ